MTLFSARVSNRDASGTPLVMIHGVGGSQSTWDLVSAHLTSSRPLVTYTLRGHEIDRENVAPPYAMTDFEDDLVALLDELGYDRVLLAGFSLGGLIAQAVALEHPDRVSALIVVGSVSNRSEQERERVLQRYREIVDDGPLGVAEKSVDRWFTDSFLAEHPEARQATLDRMSSLDPSCYAGAYRVLATSDFASRLKAVTVPVLAIAGDGDVGSPPHMSEYIANTVQHGELTVIPNVKHQLLQETPETVAKEINRFVEHNQL